MSRLPTIPPAIRRPTVYFPAAAVAIALVIAIGVWLSASDPLPDAAPTVDQSSPETGFAFFDIDRKTRLSKAARIRLEKQLGSAVVEHWANLDLEVNYPGFLADHFPRLARLNRDLKDEIVLDTKENPIRLIFRHTRQLETPFSRVELVFSSYTRQPLFFRIEPKKPEGKAVAETLRTRYGEPRTLAWDNRMPWDGRSGETALWERHGDILMCSVSPDRYGDPAYVITIYFLDNLEATLASKLERRGAQEEDESDAVRNAF